MKKFHFLLVGMLLCSLWAQAQKATTADRKLQVTGGFGGPMFVYSKLSTHGGHGAGGGGGAILGNFFIGGFGQGEDFGEYQFNERTYDLNLGYGGIWLGYVYPSDKFVHFFSSLKTGWGGVVMQHKDPVSGERDKLRDRALFIKPELGLEFNVARWLRVDLTGGYRIANGITKLPNFVNSDFNSPTIAINLRFGGFGY